MYFQRYLFSIFIYFLCIFKTVLFLWKKSFSPVGESYSKNDNLVPFNVTVPLRFLVRPYRPLPFFILDYTPLPDRPWPSLTVRFYCKFDIFLWLQFLILPECLKLKNLYYHIFRFTFELLKIKIPYKNKVFLNLLLCLNSLIN